MNALWFVIVALFFSSSQVRALFMRMGHWFERTMGVVLILFAGRLILSWWNASGPPVHVGGPLLFN